MEYSLKGYSYCSDLALTTGSVGTWKGRAGQYQGLEHAMGQVYTFPEAGRAQKHAAGVVGEARDQLLGRAVDALSQDLNALGL